LKKKKIIITGGSGFIARNLIEFFSKKKNFSITVIDKKIIKKKDKLK